MRTQVSGLPRALESQGSEGGPVTRRFARYDVERHLARPSQACAAWLTGQNSFRHSALSPSEAAVLVDLEGVGYQGLHCGFPYNAEAVELPFRKEAVIPAAWRCIAQYAAATGSTRFAREVARHLQPLFDATSEHLLLLVGSCGAQMLGAARPLLRVPDGLSVHVLALGPVGRLPEHPAAQVLRGRWDVLSHTLSRAPGRVVPCGHLGYLQEPEVRGAIREFAARTVR